MGVDISHDEGVRAKERAKSGLEIIGTTASRGDVEVGQGESSVVEGDTDGQGLRGLVGRGRS